MKTVLKYIAIVLGVLLLAAGGFAVYFVRSIRANLRPGDAAGAVPALTAHADHAASAGSLSTGARAARPFSPADFRHPPRRFRPWTRWWWPGGAVKDDELRRELKTFKDKGFGGVEVQAFAAGLPLDTLRDPASRALSYGSEAFYEHLVTTMKAAKKNGLGVDLTAGSGWPTGGPQVGPQDNIQMLAYGEKTVDGGTSIDTAVPEVHQPFAYYFAGLMERNATLGPNIMDFFKKRARLVALVAAKKTGGGRSRNPLNLADPVRLDSASLHVLTDHVNDGRLRWKAPPGPWRLVAFYRMPDGEAPVLTAARPAGYVLDPLDAGAVRAYYTDLFGEGTPLPSFYGAPFHGLFSDSFEFKAERHFADGFLKAFRQKRGYNLTPYLPAVLRPGADNFVFDALQIKTAPTFRLTSQDARIRYDYARTTSDLFAERFLDPTRRWAHARGLQSRAQPYGLRADLIDLAGHTDIPEAEQLYAGGSTLFLKLISSGAHHAGRPLTSAEAFVHTGRAYATTPQKVKAEADKLFTSGINHIVFHGTPYRLDEKGYGRAGWDPFSSLHKPGFDYSGNFSDAGPFWKNQRTLNDYIARSQYLLRRGTPTADVLVYYPFLGLPDSFGEMTSHDEPLFGGRIPGVDPKVGQSNTLGPAGRIFDKAAPDPRYAWLDRTWKQLQTLAARGLAWEWINAPLLAKATPDGNGGVTVNGRHFGAVFLPNVDRLPLNAARHVDSLAQAGVPLIVAGDTPDRQPGFYHFKQNDPKVARALDEALAAPATVHVRRRRALAAVADTLASRPGLGGPVRYAAAMDDVRYARRALPSGGALYFLRNTAPDSTRLALHVAADAGPCQWLDPREGTVARAHPAKDGRLDGALPAYGSVALMCGREVPVGEAAHAERSPIAAPGVVQRRPLTGWTLRANGPGVKGDTVTVRDRALFDWRTSPALRYAAADGRYTTTLRLDSVRTSRRYLLDLGKTYFTARVAANARPADTLAFAPYVADLTDALHAGKNEIRVTVTPALRNFMIGRAAAGDPAYAQFNDKEDSALPAGLVGPTALLVTRASSEQP